MSEEEAKSLVTIRRGDGEEVTVDLGPVESYVNRLRDGKLPVVEQIEIPAGMDREQLRFLVSMLVGEVKRYQQLWKSSFHPNHAKLVAELREMRDLVREAGYDLGESWEALGDYLSKPGESGS